MITTVVKNTLVVVFTFFTAGPLIYYSHCEFHRKRQIKKRLKIFKNELKNLKQPPLQSEKELAIAQPNTLSTISTTTTTTTVHPHPLSYWLDPESSAKLELIVKHRYASLRIGGRFQNPFEEWREQGLWEWIFWKLIYQPFTGRLPWIYNHGLPCSKDSNYQEKLARMFPSETPNFEHLFNQDIVSQKFSFTWIGQSTCYVQLDGLCILTDPIFSLRTVDSLLAPKRLRPTPCTLSDLKKIDVIIVSHSHYDHLDIKAVQQLANSVLWIIPLGLGAWFAQNGVDRYREMDWWDKVIVPIPGTEESAEIVACPTMHWSARTPLDTNQSLWNSFAIIGPRKRFFHVGDSGYTTNLFNYIGDLYGPFDLAAIPIGSYSPTWHLKCHHTHPEGSVNMCIELKARKAIGVHYGTWIMSDEKVVEPVAILRREVERKLGKEGMERFSTVPNGRTVIL